MQLQNTLSNQINLEKKNKVEVSYSFISDYDYKATAIKTVWGWYGNKNRHSIESPGINPHRCSLLIHDKEVKHVQWKRNNLINK